MLISDQVRNQYSCACNGVIMMFDDFKEVQTSANVHTTYLTYIQIPEGSLVWDEVRYC